MSAVCVEAPSLAELEARRAAIAAKLPAYLAAAGRRGFVWGGHDCCLWLADWIMAATGAADPAADYRDRYRTEAGALRLQRRAGGVEALIAGLARSAGLMRTDAPLAGDVGLTWQQRPTGRRTAIGSICTGARWACLSRDGLFCQPATVIVAWRL